MHRGLEKNRKKKAVKFLLKNLGKNEDLSPHFFQYLLEQKKFSKI